MESFQLSRTNLNTVLRIIHITHKWFSLNNVTSLSDIALLETAGVGIRALCDSGSADHNKEPSTSLNSV